MTDSPWAIPDREELRTRVAEGGGRGWHPSGDRRPPGVVGAFVRGNQVAWNEEASG
jgi:hypothetical protein